jgi:hypothetical protein
LVSVFVNLADPLGEPAAPWGGVYHPILFYDAVVMLVAPPTIAAARLPIALIGGLLSPCCSTRLRRVIGQPLQLIAALVLALAPVHVILGRRALGYIPPVPFVLGGCGFSTARFATARESTSHGQASFSASAVTATSRRGR